MNVYMNIPIEKLPPPKYTGQKIQKKKTVKKVYLVKKIDDLVSGEFLTTYFSNEKSTKKKTPSSTL